MSEAPISKSKPSISQRRYNVVLTGHVRKGFMADQVSVELARLAGIDAAQATLLLSGAARVVKTNVDQNTATQFQMRFEAIGAQCAIRPVASTDAPLERMSGTPNSAPSALNLRTVKEAFSGEIPPLTSTMKHRVTRASVAVLMLLLPSIYLVSLVAVAGVTGWHALNDWTWFWLPDGWRYPGLFVYLALCVAGVVLTLVMLKPLFAPPATLHRPLKLTHQDDPLFFALVDLIAQRVGAPMPVEIHIDCAARAAVGAQHGLLGVSSGQLVLSVGLPLFGGLTARQLAGVIAHELGRFAPRSGMIWCVLVKAVNTWFTRTVFERDAWDEPLDELIQRHNDYRGTLLKIVKGTIWLNRKFMRGFLKLGALISGRLQRHMEFDADRDQALIAGASVFRDTLLRITELGAADEIVSKRLAHSRDDGKLTDNLPKLIVEQSHTLPERYRKNIMLALQAQQPESNSKHPSAHARIAHAAALDARGIFVLDAAGTALLARYERLCRQASLMHYHQVLGVTVKPEQLVSSAAVNGHAEQRAGDEARLKSYLAEQFCATRYLNIKRQAAYAAPDAEETKRRLDNLAQQVRHGVSDYAKLLAKYQAASQQCVNAFAARLLAQQGVAFDAAVFNVGGATESDAAAALHTAAQTVATLEPELEKFEALLAQRFALALAMRADAQTQDDVSHLLQALAAVAQGHDIVINLRGYFMALDYLQRWPAEAGAAGIHDYAKDAQQEYRKLLVLVGSAPYPFERKDHLHSVADYLQSYCGTPEQFAGAEEQVRKRVENVWKSVELLHRRAVARLAAIAAEVEEKLGVEALQPAHTPAAKTQADPDDIALPF